MLVQFVSHHYSDKLGNSGEKQVGMKRFLILSFTTSNTKTVFEVVDGFFNIYSDFVGGIPFTGATLWNLRGSCPHPGNPISFQQ